MTETGMAGHMLLQVLSTTRACLEILSSGYSKQGLMEHPAENHCNLFYKKKMQKIMLAISEAQNNRSSHLFAAEL